MSKIEQSLCREAAECLVHVLRSTEFEEYVAVVVEVLRDARKCMWKVPRERHVPIVVGTASDSIERHTSASRQE